MNKSRINFLTVLLPTYNCSKYILSSIRSILLQTYDQFELLIIDDGSTDNTNKLIETIDDRRIRYVRIKHGGISDALNYGLKIAKYDWIARMDADDISLPNRFQKQIDFINKNQSYNVVSSWYATFRKKRIRQLFKLPVDNQEIVSGLCLHSTLCHASSIYNKQLILSSGGYKNRSFEDYDLWLRLMGKARFYNIPEPLILVRVRDDSLFRKDLKIKKNKMITLQREHISNNKIFTVSEDNSREKYSLEAWREWFYGDKKKSRRLWFQYLNFIFRDYKIVIAYFMTFLPEGLFELLKSINIKNWLIYILSTDRKTKKMLNRHLCKYK